MLLTITERPVGRRSLHLKHTEKALKFTISLLLQTHFVEADCATHRLRSLSTAGKDELR